METGHNEQRSPNHTCKDCDLTTEDDDTIQVSVNPRRFTLPSPNEKRKSVEIENKNSYPIYFKAGTSNMGAFRPQPNTGKIPANGKITVIVQFFDSATPIRRHEEVLVVASVRPFDQFSSYSDGICPYCSESVQLSRNHQPRKFSHLQTTGQQRDHEDCCYFDERRFPQNTTEENNSRQPSKEQVVRKNKNPGMPKKDNQSTDYSTKEVDAPAKQGLLQYYRDSISRQSVLSKEELQSDDSSSIEFDSRQTIPKKSMTYRGSRLPDTSDMKVQSSTSNDPVEDSAKSSREHLAAEDRQECVAKTTCTSGLEEICLHAFIHRPTHGDCHCNNCAELSFLPSGDFQIKNLQRKSTVEPTKTTEPSISRHESGELRTVAKKDQTKSDLREIKDLEKVLEEKKREAHILARIIKAKDVKDTSDTEMSEMSSKDSKLSRKRPKFISEEDFKKRALKARAKKYQKRLEEESTSTTTTDVTAVAKEKEPAPERMLHQTFSPKKDDDQSALGSIDAKCTTILQLTWTTLFLLILLLIVLIAFVVFFCTSSGQNGGEGKYITPCFFSLFK